MERNKVSYDFDDTLSNGRVQAHALSMMDKGYEVWVVTSRLPNDRAPSSDWNNDLFFVCDRLGIPHDRVVFTSYAPKHEFFWDGKDNDFLFHLDDDIDEVNEINNMTNMKAFHFPYKNKKIQLEILNKLSKL